jgi:hypothetical protein
MDMRSRLQDTVTADKDMSEAWSFTSSDEGTPGNGLTMGDRESTGVVGEAAVGSLNITSSL